MKGTTFLLREREGVRITIPVPGAMFRNDTGDDFLVVSAGRFVLYCTKSGDFIHQLLEYALKNSMLLWARI